MYYKSLIRTIVISLTMVFFIGFGFSQNNNPYWLFDFAINKPDSFSYVNQLSLNDSEKLIYNAHKLAANQSIDSALALYFNLTEIEENEDLIPDINYFIGVLYTKNSNYLLGLDFLLKSIQTMSDESRLSYVKEAIGDNYFIQENFETALQHFDEAAQQFNQLGNQIKVAWLYNKMGKCYLGLDETSDADEYFEESILLFEELGIKEGIVSIFGNMAWSSFKDGDYYLAKKNCFHSLRENIALGNVVDEMDALYLLGKIENEEGDDKAAEAYFIDAFNLAIKLKELKYVRDVSFELSELYKKEKDYKQANQFLTTYINAKDKLFDKEQLLAVQQLSANYEFEKQKNEIENKNAEIELLKASEKYQKQRSIAYIALIFLLVVVGFLIMHRLRQQKQKQLEINVKEKELAESKKALIEAELKSTQWESQELKNRLSFKNKELQNFALHIVEKNEFLQGLNADLAKLNAELKDESSKSMLKETRTKISYNLSLEKDRTEFQNYVEQVNEEFFLRLTQQFPTVTDTEKRLAALLRMNLSSKEISTIMNITPKSVDMNRYRLRKKFEIENSVSLSEYISKI